MNNFQEREVSYFIVIANESLTPLAHLSLNEAEWVAALFLSNKVMMSSFPRFRQTNKGERLDRDFPISPVTSLRFPARPWSYIHLQSTGGKLTEKEDENTK